jgi:PhnB protein
MPIAIKENRMASRLNPYISFAGNARPAMEFYQSVLGGELTLSTFAEGGMPDPAAADLIMHAQLVTPDGYCLMGSDTPPGMTYVPAAGISVSLSGDDLALRGYFEKLATGGQITMPLEKQVWGDEFGMAVDQFGIAWMVNITQNA